MWKAGIVEVWKCGSKYNGASVEVSKYGSVVVWKSGIVEAWKCGFVEVDPNKTGKSQRFCENREKALLGHSTHVSPQKLLQTMKLTFS